MNASSVTPTGQAPVAEGDLGERELAGEPRRLEPLQAGRAPRAEAERALIRRLEPRFEHAHERRARAAVHANGRERVPGRVAAIGPIEDLPVAKLSAAAEPDRAGADAAERKGDLRQLRAGEDARVRHTRGDAPGCAEAGRAVGAGAAGGETCPAPSAAPTGMAAAAAALSDCLRKSRRPCAAGPFFDGMVAEYRRFSVRKAGGGT